MLESIFKYQQSLIDKYLLIEAKNGIGHGLLTDDDYKDGKLDINSHRVQYLLKDMAWRITEELGEAMNNLKNRPWKKMHIKTNKAAYEEELIDAFHFFIELLITSGFTPTKLYKAYVTKADINKKRQSSGY